MQEDHRPRVSLNEWGSSLTCPIASLADRRSSSYPTDQPPRVFSSTLPCVDPYLVHPECDAPGKNQSHPDHQPRPGQAILVKYQTLSVGNELISWRVKQFPVTQPNRRDTSLAIVLLKSKPNVVTLFSPWKSAEGLLGRDLFVIKCNKSRITLECYLRITTHQSLVNVCTNPNPVYKSMTRPEGLRQWGCTYSSRVEVLINCTWIDGSPGSRANINDLM